MYNKLLNLIQFNSMDGWIDGWMDPSLIPNLILIPMVKEDLVFQRQFYGTTFLYICEDVIP